MNRFATVSLGIAITAVLTTLVLVYLQILIPASAYDSFILNLPQIKLGIHDTDGTIVRSSNPSLPYHRNILPFVTPIVPVTDNHIILGNIHGQGKGLAFARSILDGTVYFYRLSPSFVNGKDTTTVARSSVFGTPVYADIDLRLNVYEEGTIASPRELDVCVSLIYHNRSILSIITSLADAPSCTRTYRIGPNDDERIFEGKVITVLNVIPTVVALQYQHPPGAQLLLDIGRMVPMVPGARAGKGDTYNVSFTFTVNPSSVPFVDDGTFTPNQSRKKYNKAKDETGYVLLLSSS